MQLVTIGRAENCNVRMSDPLVSNVHCQILRDDNGEYRLVDCNSQNGTFVNGMRCRGEVRLNRSDIIRIGNTTIPWQTYFPQSEVQYGAPAKTNVAPRENTVRSESQTTGLGITALVLSIIGAGIMIYCAVQMAKLSILGAWLLTKVPVLIWVSVGVNVLAFILGCIADNSRHKDAGAAAIAKWLSLFCVIAVIGFYVYIKFINPEIVLQNMAQKAHKTLFR